MRVAHRVRMERLLLTGREHGPELHYVLAAIARDDALARVRRGLDLLQEEAS